MLEKEAKAGDRIIQTNGDVAGAAIERPQVEQLLNCIPDALLTVDRDWRITYANREAGRLGHRDPATLFGQTFWSVWPDTPGTIVESHYRRAMEQGVTCDFEYYYAAFEIWYEIRVSPIDEGIAISYRDITGRKHGEEELRTSEARYRVLTEVNPQLIWMTDAGGGITFWNRKMLEYTGLTREEIAGQGWISVPHPDDTQQILSVWTTAVERDVDFEMQFRIRRADGEYRWFHARGLPVRDDNGVTQQWLGVCVDIHESKLVAEELRKKTEEVERQLAEIESLYQTAPIGLALFSVDEFRYLRLNQRQADIVGLPPEKILGRTLTEIAPIKGLHEMFEQVAKGEPVINVLLEGELPMQPGVHRYWTVNYYPVYGTDGKIRAITAASLEITPQKQAEQALVQSEKLAAVGRLASSISHEINNPLEAVTNLLYLIAADAELGPPTRSMVRTAQSELARVSQIATQTLRFHRQSHKPTMERAAGLLNPVLDLYQGRLANSHIQVQAVYRSVRPVWCFESEIRQVLNNLIANAIDAMRQGGRLMLRAHDATDWQTGRKGIRLTIADNGHGIAPEAQMRLFEAFYTTKGLNGTGLGLWISQEIVHRHRGRLTLRSSHGVGGRSGTVFCLFLPCEMPAPDSQA